MRIIFSVIKRKFGSEITLHNESMIWSERVTASCSGLQLSQNLYDFLFTVNYF